jgi:hypothetical protein
VQGETIFTVGSGISANDQDILVIYLAGSKTLSGGQVIIYALSVINIEAGPLRDDSLVKKDYIKHLYGIDILLRWVIDSAEHKNLRLVKGTAGVIMPRLLHLG